MWIRANLKENAKVAFKRNYWKCVLVALILGIVTGAGSGAVSSTTGSTTSQTTESIIDGDYYEGDDIFEDDMMDSASSILSGISGVFMTTALVVVLLIVLVFAFALQFFLFGPLEVGCSNFFKKNAFEKVELNELTLAFRKNNYMKMAITMFLRNLYTALWTLLFIIPGLIKSYEYRMIPYILADCPDIPRQEAFRISKEMMMGNKWNAFILDLSFFGWALLATMTCGIAGIFYVKPYIAATDAELFIAIREEYFKGQRGE